MLQHHKLSQLSQIHHFELISKGCLHQGTVYDIGVLMFPDYQWLDAVGPIDYLNTHKRLVNKAFVIRWHYLSATGTLDPVQATSGPPQHPTTTFKTCPSPGLSSTPRAIATRYPDLQGILTVCTGSMMLAQTGILDGVQACSNKWALNLGVEKGWLNRKVKWVGDRRFIVDGKIWSGAGVTAGIDLAAEFVRIKGDAEIAKLVQEITEYSPNPAQPDPFARMLEGVKLD
ncbi:ThiJ/PfpI [Coprinopsis sp. MPI-PUGE-AT-0042]|nr:ThiJ/PfpI [Coprinopsis sp. MPI-PUGE-AT-0042]